MDKILTDPILKAIISAIRPTAVPTTNFELDRDNADAMAFAIAHLRALGYQSQDDRNHMVLVCTSEHGAATPAERLMMGEAVAELLAGTAATSAAARGIGAPVLIVNCGSQTPPPAGVVDLGLGSGSGSDDLTREPATLDDDALVLCVRAGVALAASVMERGRGLLALGHVGFGNAGSIEAMVFALTDGDVAELGGSISPIPQDVAVLSGIILMAAAKSVAVILGDDAAVAAALLAYHWCPESRHVLIAAHQGASEAARRAMAALELKPLMEVGMQRSAGAGAAMALATLDRALFD